MAGADTAKMLAQADYKDNLSKGIAKSIKSIDALDKRLGRIGNTAARGVGTAAKNLAKIGLIAGGAVAGGLLLAAKRAGEFDQQMRTINTIARVTDTQLGAVGKSIRDLARSTGADLADLTGGYYDVLSAGITDTADAQKVLTAATKLSIGALSTSGEAVDLLTTAINAYGLKAGDATRISDLFAKSVEIGKVKASDIAATLSQVAPIARTAGVGLEEIAASYGALTAQGVDASEVTTQMSRAILELLKPSKALKTLMKDTGHNFAEIAREKGLHAALTLLASDAEAAGIPLTQLFGRVEGAKYVLQTTGDQAGIFESALAAMGDSAGTAEEQFAEAEKGFGYTMGRLKQSAIDASISLGTGLLPGLSKMADTIGRLVGEHGPQLERFGKQIGKVVDAIATRLGGPDAKKAIDDLFNALDRGLSDTNIKKAIDSIGDMFGLLKSAMPALKNALSLSGQVVGRMVELFNAMPPWVKTAVLTGWGLNKLTGGALSSIIGEIGKGIIKGVMNLVAGVVNIKAGVVNGTGGVGGAGGGWQDTIKTAIAIAIPLILTQLPKLLPANPTGTSGRDRLSLENNPFGFLFPSLTKQTEKNTADTATNTGGTRTALGLIQTNTGGTRTAMGLIHQGVAATTAAVTGGLAAILAELPKLKPIHLSDEIGKSIQSAQHKEVRGLDIKDPNLTVKLDKDITALAKHYMNNKHPMSFLEPRVTKTLSAMDKLMLKAIEDGNDPLAKHIAGKIKELEKATGVHSRSADRHIRDLKAKAAADAAALKAKQAATAAAIKDQGTRQLAAIHGDTSTTGRNLDQVTTAIRNKKLQVKVVQNQKQSSAMSLRNITGATTQGKPGFHYTSSQGQDLSRFLAGGAVGLASQPMSAVFGEAGKEAFAILRNPRKGTIGGGGTTVNVTVNIDPRRITKKQTSSGIYKTYVST